MHRSLEYYCNQHNHENSRQWARKSTLLCHLINTAVIPIKPCIWPAVACLENRQNTCPLSFRLLQICKLTRELQSLNLSKHAVAIKQKLPYAVFSRMDTTATTHMHILLNNTRGHSHLAASAMVRLSPQLLFSSQPLRGVLLDLLHTRARMLH